jgi:hypothetical protein
VATRQHPPEIRHPDINFQIDLLKAPYRMRLR